MKLNVVATTVFGMESIVAQELKQLGFENTIVENGSVRFETDPEGLFKANLWVRTAERLYVLVGAFKATSFESLFNQVNELPWENYIPEEGAFPVLAKSVKSQLFSLSDIQKIGKKAVAKRLTKAYRTEWFPEKGERYTILISLLKDEARVMLDASGTGLHKRGYREMGNEAPMKETLAAGLLAISRWNAKLPLIDPFCGSGTIPIEAACIAKNIAPGLNREFDCERWAWMDKEMIKSNRKAAYAAIDHHVEVSIEGYDNDPRAIRMCKENAISAGVEDCIHFQVRAVENFSTSKPYGSIICNPPYGERLSEKSEIHELYQTMGRVFSNYKRWSKFVITSYEDFEKAYGEKASKNRKLYNGRIKTYFYQYYGERPKRKPEGALEKK